MTHDEIVARIVGNARKRGGCYTTMAAAMFNAATNVDVGTTLDESGAVSYPDDCADDDADPDILSCMRNAHSVMDRDL